MSMLCVFGTIRNAGMSLTEKTNANLIKMYNYVCSCNDTVEYKDFQKMVRDNCDITESNVRMYSPFLYAHGFVKDYKNGTYKVSDFFTPLGTAYVKSLIVSSKIKNEVCREKAMNITKDILSLSLFERKIIGQKDYYFDFLMFCDKYDSISVKEFNYMLYEKEVLGNKDYVNSISETINQFRKGEIDYDFQQKRTNKKGKKVMEPFPDNTFNYTRSLLVEAGLVIEADNGTYKINPDKARVARILVEEV